MHSLTAIIDVDPLPSDPLDTIYDLLSNITLDSTQASTSSSGTGPGISKKKTDPREEGETSWKIHLRAGLSSESKETETENGDIGKKEDSKGDTEKWFEMQDLRVEEVRKEMVFLGETVVQVWERRTAGRMNVVPGSRPVNGVVKGGAKANGSNGS